MSRTVGKAGRAAEGLDIINKSLEYVQESEERYDEAELYRLKGELLLQTSPDHPALAEAAFRQGRDAAQLRQAKALELRVTLSWAKCLNDQGQSQDAHEMLDHVLAWFKDDTDMADVTEAKAFLQTLT